MGQLASFLSNSRWSFLSKLTKTQLQIPRMSKVDLMEQLVISAPCKTVSASCDGSQKRKRCTHTFVQFC
jgi:hypothetical protein